MNAKNTVSNAMKTKKCNRWILIPIAVAALVFLVAAGYYALNNAMKPSGIVTFDTVKYINARRMMTTRLLGKDGDQKREAISVLSRVQNSSMKVINEIADGRTVVVRQALVIDGQVPDITDKVLTKLGLPTDAGTIQPQKPNPKLMTPFTQSKDYQDGKTAYKNNLKAVKKENAEYRKERKQARKAARKKSINSILP